ncbi:flavin monoamine oxidase family protein [Spirosoma linguale]|uniref:Amine oxidase n=1 Tax=Spirosoma linguale (strain ATCC 33905 / DSM 74 / LMG 10896 / Claus 1) TaxID=504472 RepID=D2QC36_SPILD|nr:amine oxidase [Spirosoma linguale DSM 74]
MKTERNCILIGGGLSGLALAYLLTKEGVATTILEASDRLGGRIQTLTGPLGTPLELGATWFSDVHTHLLALLSELGLPKYPQHSGGISLFQTKSFEPPQAFFVPAADNPSYRLAGGTQRLIDKLAQTLPPQSIRLNTPVRAINQSGDLLSVELADGSALQAHQVICCLPPQLAASRIQFSPALPEMIAKLLPTVQTWMAGSIKFVLEYDEPFWRQAGYSGMLYSHAGLVTEMYDHTNLEQNRFGFTGFLNGSAVAYSPEVRREFVLRQLGELFGPKAAQPSAYVDKVWNDEYVLAGSPVILRPHQHNGHPALQAGYMDNRLHFCGTETASAFGGYMEGAVMAARSVAERVLG